MLLHISELLSKPECAAIREALSGVDWTDGAATAAGQARAVKSNQQADTNHPAVRGVLKKVENTLSKHEVFEAAARPAGFARLILSRYQVGMAYGAHVDAPYINNTRTDVSFTLFLSEPDSYDGGELVIDAPGHEDVVKGAAGDVVVYPSTAVHRVAPVERGERLACVGWVKSRVKSTQERMLLFELETALADLRKTGAHSEIRTRLSNVRNNLVRLFGE